MKRKIAKALTIATILLAIAFTINLQTNKASAAIVVPDDYATINQAVSQASPGDTVLVKAGVYYENIQINKTLAIEGESGSVIIGSGGNQTNAVITLSADSVNISGFTVESLNYSTATYYAYGIIVNGDHCTINGNTITNTYIGIFSSTSKFTAITNNKITSSIKDGIRIFGGSQDTISNNNLIQNAVSGIAINGYSDTISENNLQDNYRGIGLGVSYSILFNNQITWNQESGIWLAGSNNIIYANTLYKNKYGVFINTQLAAPRANNIYNNNFVNNSINAFDNSSSLIENWDNGYQLGGNYWSDYFLKYPNASQIQIPFATRQIQAGDTPYMINANNTDNYALTDAFANSSHIPNLPSPSNSTQNGLVASWTFDSINADGVVPDSTGNNPAVLGGASATGSYTPVQVKGEFGEALSFNGRYYALVQPSPSLEISNEATIDVWVNVQSIKNVSYNNIFVEAMRTTAPLPTRTLGLAINGDIPQNASSPPQGALRGYVLTQNGVLNEIDTKQSVPLNQWIHVVFTRSLTTGMHIYINGQEQQVQVASGVANPAGPIQRQTEIYIGHDSITNIDQLQISNTVEPRGQSFWSQWWIWTIIFVAAIGGLLFYFNKVFRIIREA